MSDCRPMELTLTSAGETAFGCIRNGRLILAAGNGTLLGQDGPSPYRKIPKLSHCFQTSQQRNSKMVIKPESTKQSMNNILELRKEVEKINWWHKIDLGNGIITPSIDITPEKLKWIQMNQNLVGKSVLDIGAWDGFFSFEAERRGASRVLAVDSPVWKNGAKEGFELAEEKY